MVFVRASSLVGSVCAMLVAALMLWASPAEAQNEKPLKGIALIIGQSAYANLPALPNPGNDARAVERLLSDLGFEVTPVFDGDHKKLERALSRFAEDAVDADVALVYYSGHGVEAGGENYLVPVDARLPAQGSAADDLVPLAPLLETLQSKAPVAILLLDACRNNPYPPGTTIGGASGVGAPVSAVGLSVRGAAKLRQQGNDTLGAVIGYAAEPGKAALDGEAGGNSPYAAALLKHLAAHGYAFGDVMTLVSEEVYLKTGGRQLPWTNASLRRLLYFGLSPEREAGDEQSIRDGRRTLLLTIASTPPETRRLVEQVAASNAVPLDALYGMLSVLGVDKANGNIAQQLSQGAVRLKTIMEARNAETRQDPEIIRLSTLADEAEKEGTIALSLDFRDRASARADQIDKALDEAERNIAGRRLELAATYASNADTAILNFDFKTAAARYGDAFEQAQRWDLPQAYRLKIQQADALADLGDYKGDNAALESSLQNYAQALEFGKSSPNARRDAAIKGNMAIVMTRLGERASDTSWFDRAAQIYKDISATTPRKRDPTDWAYIQLNLGGLYNAMAQRGTGGKKAIKLAMAAYRNAATVMTRAKMPEQWAGLQMNIGNMQAQLGDAGDGMKSYRDSVASIEAALTIWTQEKFPVEWALAQGNLATSLRVVGEDDKDPKLLRRAIDALDGSMSVATRDRQPMSWAGNMVNLGNVYLDLAEIDADQSLYVKAIASYVSARTVITREVDANRFASTWYNQGRALLFLARREGSVTRLMLAKDALDTAIDVLAQSDNPVQWARAKSVLAETLVEIGHRTGDRDALTQARDGFDAARKTFIEQGLGKSGQGFWDKQIRALDQELAR